MDPEEKKLLEDTHRLAEESNRIIRKMRRAQRRASFMSLLYWIFIIGAAVGAFYFIQPYVNALLNGLKSAGVNVDKFSSIVQKK